MKICNYIVPELVFLDARLPDKDAIIEFIADACARQHIVNAKEKLQQAMVDREETMSTGIGNGMGLPHAVSDEVTQPAIILIRPERPVDFGAIDSLPVDIVVGMVIPAGQTALHIQILAAVSRLCKNNRFPRVFRSAEEPERLVHDITQLESEMAFH